MLFSIIIPTYNNLELFKRALESVLVQDEQSYEIIVVDDSSNDIISQYVSKLSYTCIRYYHNSPSKGAVRNWNYGLSLCRGDNVLLLHHDEAMVGNGYLRNLKECVKKSDIVVSNVVVYNNGYIKKNRIIKYNKRIVFMFPCLFFLINPIGPTACVCVKKECIEPFNEDLVWLVDVEWYYRLFRRNAYYLSKQTIGSIHGHDGQITNTINIKKVEEKDLKILFKQYKTNFCTKVILFLRKVVDNVKWFL